MLHGVDISGHQDIWDPVPADTFVFIKATEGRTFRSPDYNWQLQKARTAQDLVGHYHFTRPGNAKEQAAYFVSQIDDLRSSDLLVCDWEEGTPEGHPTVSDAANFIAEVKRLRPENKVGLYCNKSDWLGTQVKKGDFLWLAYYTTQPDPGVKDWDFWQYSRRPIDQSWASPRFATFDDLVAWAKADPEADPLFWSETWQSWYLSFGGESKWVTPIDKEILIACGKAVGWGTIRIVQGGRRPETSFSGTTHMGLGVEDISPDGRPKEKVWEYCAALRRSGMRPFPRGYGGDPWADEKHIHNASRESYEHASSSLQAQIREQEAGGDGLKGGGKYNGPTYAKLDVWKGSPYNPINIKADTGVYRVTSDLLNGRNVDNGVVRTRAKGYVIQAAQQVYRWGRWNVVTGTPTYYALEGYLEPV